MEKIPLKEDGEKTMKKSTIIILICISILLGMIFGIVFSILDDKKIEQAQVNEIIKVNELIEKNIITENKITEDIVQTNQSDIKLSPNAVICFETYYKDCGHTIVQKEQIKDEEVNKTEEYLKKAYSDWSIEDFNSNEVKLYQEVEGTCNEHYLISIKDENIAIYTIDSEGNKILKEETDIPIIYLPQEDIELLKQGITANGENELARKLEDFE